MPRALRLHVPGGVYFVDLTRDTSLPPLFVEEQEYGAFEQIFGNTLRACSAQAFAFSWEPRAIRFAVQIAHVPISSLMRRLMTAYAKKIRHERRGAAVNTHVRYRALLVDPEPYLFKLVCYLHWVAVLHRPDATVEQHPQSSHAFYLGSCAAPWLECGRVLNQLNHNRSLARYSYIHRIREKPNAADIRGFEQGGELDPRILGDEYFIVGLPRHLPVHRSHISLDQLMHSIAVHCEVTAEDICSSLDAPQLPLARALLAWHATHRGIATLVSVADRLRRKPPTLISLIKHHRPRNAELFVLGAIPDIKPIVLRVASRAAAEPTWDPAQERRPAYTTLDQIIEWAALQFGPTPDIICSGARGERLSLIRSVIAWQAYQRGIADIKQVAQRMHRSPDALYYGIRQFRASQPELFSLTAMPQVTSLSTTIARRARATGASAVKRLRSGSGTRCSD